VVTGYDAKKQELKGRQLSGIESVKGAVEGLLLERLCSQM